MVRSTSQLFDPSTLGVKGRRAGTTLSQDIPRDKQGLEEIDAYFQDLEKQRDTPRRSLSGPAKTPKSSKQQSKVGKLKSESMRKSIAKPSSSLSRSHTISSPAKRQPSSSSKKGSSKTKSIFKNLFGDDRPSSSGSRSRLSESDEEEPPRFKSAKKTQKRVVEREPESEDEESEDENLPDTQRDDDQDDNSEVDNAQSEESAGEQDDSDDSSGQEDGEDEEQEEESDDESIREPSPPPPPPPKKTKTSKPKAQPTKPSKKTTPLEPKSSNARVSKATSKSQPKAQKSKPIQRALIPSPPPDDDGPRGVRRSGREKRAPLEYWRGERLHVQLDEDGENIKVKALTKPPEEVVPFRKKTSYSQRPYNQGRKSRRDESEDEDSDFEMESKVSAEVFQYPHEDQKGARVVSWAPQNIKYLDVKNSSYSLATLYDQDSSFNAGGMIKIKVHGEKPLKPSKMNNYIFYVASGRVEVTISNRSFRLKSGGSFEVPRGNWYSIVNISKTREAVLFFVQSTDTEFNNDLAEADEEGSAQGEESSVSD